MDVEDNDQDGYQVMPMPLPGEYDGYAPEAALSGTAHVQRHLDAFPCDMEDDEL